MGVYLYCAFLVYIDHSIYRKVTFTHSDTFTPRFFFLSIIQTQYRSKPNSSSSTNLMPKGLFQHASCSLQFISSLANFNTGTDQYRCLEVLLINASATKSPVGLTNASAICDPPLPPLACKKRSWSASEFELCLGKCVCDHWYLRNVHRSTTKKNDNFELAI